MSEQRLILVDASDRQTGFMDKMEAHRKGLLHRAFSIFIFNRSGDMLLQQRADQKYHSPGLWTNACCSHPYPGEAIEEAAKRRLKEELGFATVLEEQFTFTYKADLDNGLTEHEFDHVFTGVYDGTVQPDRTEVKDWRYMNMDDLIKDVRDHPEDYTVWFRIALPRVREISFWEQNPVT